MKTALDQEKELDENVHPATILLSAGTTIASAPQVRDSNRGVEIGEQLVRTSLNSQAIVGQSAGDLPESILNAKQVCAIGGGALDGFFNRISG